VGTRRTTGAAVPVPLTGADCFLRAFDAEIRRRGGANHLSQLVLRLGPGFDPGILQKLLEDVARAQPILGAPIRRRFGLGPPVYRVKASRRAAPALGVVDAEPCADGEPPLPALFAERLNEPMAIRRGELLRFDAVRYADGAAGTDLAMTWAHMLFDGVGSERFVRWLDECFRGERRPDGLPDPAELERPTAPRPALRERGRAARSWQRWHDGFGALPLRSPAGPGYAGPQSLRYDLLRLGADESRRVSEAAARRAGFLTPMLFYLAAAIRAHHAVFRTRGVDPGSYLVPLPVNLRRRGSEGAIFRTHVSLIWFHVPADGVDDLEDLLGRLKSQRLAAIREGHVENGVHAMDFARLAPARLYAHMARRALRGELCSFFFAYTGEFLPGLERFLGAGIRSGFHVAPVPPSPGSCVALSFHRGRLGATHVHQAGVFSEPERRIFGEQLRADLLGRSR
jgi:hypothetical protein